MTHDNLATVSAGVSQDEARRLLHQRRIEKLLVVDDDYRCIGLITVKDMEKAVLNPDATKDAGGRLRVAAATTVGDKGFERTEALVDAECDVIVIDTAHGHNKEVAARGRAGQAAVERGPGHRRQRRHRRGDARRWSVPARTRSRSASGRARSAPRAIVAGVGVPQLTAIMEAAERGGRRAGHRRRRPAHLGRCGQGARRGRLDA